MALFYSKELTNTLKNDMDKVNFSIIGKDGKVKEDLNFNDFDTLADHMMDVASNWYEGLYDPDEGFEIKRFDENDNLVSVESRKFGDDINDEFDEETFDLKLPDLPDLGDAISKLGGESKTTRKSGKGFGKSDSE
jgi:hypothetical protein